MLFRKRLDAAKPAQEIGIYTRFQKGDDKTG
jgi:hypothetical protein